MEIYCNRFKDEVASIIPFKITIAESDLFLYLNKKLNEYLQIMIRRTSQNCIIFMNPFSNN